MPNRGKVIGIERTIRGVRRGGRAAADSLARHLHAEGEQIMGEAKLLTPVLTGALRASGHVPPVQQLPGQVLQRLSFGDASVDYAAEVHERTDIAHRTGVAKFLSIPAEAAAIGMPSRLAAAVALDLERATPGP